MTRRLFGITVLCIVFLAIAGCAGGQTGNVPADAANTAATETMLLADPRQGLDTMDGYHAVVVNEFTGTQDGKELHSRLEMTADSNRAAGVMFVDLRQASGAGQERRLLNGMASKAAYSRVGDEKSICHITWQPQGQPPLIQPADVLPAVLFAKKVGDETVDGVPTMRYTLDAKSLGTDVETLNGDLWLADPGGYVVKFDLTMAGGEKTFGKGRSGTQTLTYALTKINANDDFELPEGCQPVLTDVPEMPGAKNVNRLPDTLRYTTDSPAEKVLAFYQEQLGADGWKWGDVHTSTGGDQIILFFHTNEPDSLRVRLSKREAGVDVSVVRLKAAVMPEGGSEDNPDETGAPAGNPMEPEKAGLPDGVTVYPGSSDFTGVEGIRLVFNAPDPVDTVKDFYLAEVKKAGWTMIPGSESSVDIPLMFNKGNQVLFIKAGEGDGGTRVEITWMKH